MDNLPLDMPCTLFMEGPIGPNCEWIVNPRFGGTLLALLQNLSIAPKRGKAKSFFIESEDRTFRLAGNDLVAAAKTPEMQAAMRSQSAAPIWEARVPRRLGKGTS